MGRASSVINVLIALPIMVVLLMRSVVSRLWSYGVGRIAVWIMVSWLLAGVLAVLVTAPDPMDAMWADARMACQETSPGSWPFEKPLLKLSGCVSWTYDAMAESFGWQDARAWIAESYGTMVAGLTAGGLNRQFLVQGLLITLWLPVVIVYLPVAAVMFGVRQL